MPNTKSAKRKVKLVARQTTLNKLWKRRCKIAIKKMDGILKKNSKKEILFVYLKKLENFKFVKVWYILIFFP